LSLGVAPFGGASSFDGAGGLLTVVGLFKPASEVLDFIRKAKHSILEAAAIRRKHVNDSLTATPCLVASDGTHHRLVSNLAAGHLKANQLLKFVSKAHLSLPVFGRVSLTIRTVSAEQIALIPDRRASKRTVATQNTADCAATASANCP
jgi:hypothetical protein